MSSVPVERRNHVLCYVVLQHQGQYRKYTGEAYHFHLQSVAKMADGKCNFGYEIGLCHDLLEDTETTKDELYLALRRFGYDTQEADFITERVVDLTDVYITENFPRLNRAKRKTLESSRLHTIHPTSQTVKYCDLIDNTTSIVEHDKGFAKKYLAEKASILKGMTNGNPAMLAKCKRVLKKALKEIGLEINP